MEIELTMPEKDALQATKELWRYFLDLPIEHPDDIPEMKTLIHTIQAKIMMRPIRRNQIKQAGL